MDRYEYKSTSVSGIVRNVLLLGILITLLAIGSKLDKIGTELKKQTEAVDIIEK